MRNLFPPMNTRPKTGFVIAILVWWGMAFVLIPMWMPFMCLGIWGNYNYMSWFEIGYHVVNGVLMASFLKDYFSEGWFMVGVDKKFYLGHAALTLGLMVGATVLMMVAMAVAGVHPLYLLNAFPVVELSVAQTPGLLASVQPVFGTACMVLFSPVSVCGLFYVVGFAPLCNKCPWLAYINVAVITLVPVLIDVIWRQDQVALMMDMYLTQLPVHLLACWSYQKTDNICTPVMALGAINLLGAVTNILLG